MNYLPFALLRPIPPNEAWKPEIDPADILVSPDIEDCVFDLSGVDVVVIDLETRGTSVADPETQIVGVGIAWRRDEATEARYYNWTAMSDVARSALLGSLATADGAVIAHNVLFDGAHLWRAADELMAPEPKWTHCTYGLYKQLASEAWPGQSHGLKAAQVDLLGWPETNEAGIDEWLVANGFVTPSKSADKSQMWRCPPEILGPYCLLDCISTLQLFDLVLWPALEKFPELERWHREVFVPMDRLLWMQQASGILMDVDALRAHGELLRAKMREAEKQTRDGPLGPGILLLEHQLIAEHIAKEPPKHKKVKLGQEPSRTTKAGETSKSWLKWDAKRRREPEVRLDWIAWDAKLKKIEAGELPEFRFNPGSVDQLRALLFGEGQPGRVEFRDTGRTRKKKGRKGQVEVPIFEILGVNGWVEMDCTEAGQLPVNGDLYSQLPAELGKPLQLYADAEQELGYVEAYLAAARWHANEGAHRIHPGWIAPGTKTGRLAGKDPNLQQIPKTIEFLRCLKATPGFVWVEMDWSSLEPHVLAELSRDPALLKLYGPDAKKHDVYLYSAAHYAVVGDTVRQHYDVNNPDVASAKKALKKEREAAKVVVLAKSYGAGAAKIHSTLRLRGIQLTSAEAKQISDSHDEMYAASGRQFHDQLEREWHDRGGYVLSALGHPIPVWERAKKDLINRVIQKSGHDVHTTFAVQLARRLHEEGIGCRGIVWDFHDQLIFEVPAEQGELCLGIVREEVARLNEKLGAYVKLKGEPKLCTDMAIAKEAEYSWCAEKK